MTIPKWMYEVPIAHRGYFDDEAPENSLAAFKKAIDRGFAVEMDVQILKDGTLVVFHDDDLERMTGKKGLLREMTYEDIQSLKLKGTNEGIPTFESFLTLIDGQIPLMIEFKNDTFSNALEEKSWSLLKTYKGEFVIQSFNPKSVLWFKKNQPQIVRGQLSYDYKASNYNKIMKHVLSHVWLNLWTKPDYVIYDIQSLESPVINGLRKKGMPLFSYTAKSKKAYDYAMNLNIPPCFEGFDPEK